MLAQSLLALALLPNPAQAFCGTYVAGAGADIYNSVSQVALVRQGTRTTLSVANDVQGDFDNFAMLVPVPEVLGQDDIHTLDADIFDRLDRYSRPRLVRYDCEDFEYEGDTDTDGDSDTDADADADDTGVVIEAEYVVGEYQIVILSATQSGALVSWLNDHDYAVPQATENVLTEYIEGGSYFFAAQVNEDAGIQPGDTLSPLQFSYDSDIYSLPIRIGTASAKEMQDLIVYGINNYSDGKLGISNYPEVQVEDECLWKSDGEEFGAFYNSQFTTAYDGTEGAAWATEYAWGAAGCDPCEGPPPEDVDLISLGYDQSLAGEDRTIWDVYFTRLHMRYAPDEATTDVVLYHSHITSQEQQRYVEYAHELEDRFPICGLGWADDPGSCDPDDEDPDDEDPTDGDDDDDDDDSDSDETSKGCACGSAVAPGSLMVLSLIGLVGVARRRA
jgi:hypothetical protein